jgi:hypothetical protein
MNHARPLASGIREAPNCRKANNSTLTATAITAVEAEKAPLFYVATVLQRLG